MNQNQLPSPEPARHIPGSPMPLSPSSTPATGPVVTQKRSHRKAIILGIIGLVVAGVLGGSYFAYSKGYISIPWLTPKEDQLFNRLVDSLSAIDNAQYTVQAKLQSEPRSAGTTSVFPSGDERRAQSRDSQRKLDMERIRKALVLYFDDQNKYPESLATGLAPNYLTTVPTDPKDKSPYQYQSCDTQKHFVLQTGLESGEYFFITDTKLGATGSKVPACGQATNVSRGLLPWLVPVAHAQATTFSIESVGSEIGLGQPETNYPFLNLLDLFGLGNLASVLDVFPADIDAAAAITFYAEADKSLADANARLAISGRYRGDDLTAEFDLEGRKLGSTVFGTIRKFPGIPYLSQYVSPIKNKWVKIEPGDGNPFIQADTFRQTSIKTGIERTRQSLKDALEGKIVTVEKKLGPESIAGVQSVHYRVALHPDQLKPVLEKIVAGRKSKKQDVKTLESAIKELDKPATQASLQRLVDNSTVEVWVDKVQGYLRQISWGVVLVPPDDSPKLQGKQFRLTLTLTLDKVNQRVNIDRPADAIDFNEAERLVTGISVEEQKFNHQRRRVDAIRNALRQIHDANDSYPSSIENLDQSLKEAIQTCKTKRDQARNTNTDVSIYCNEYLTDQGPITVTDVYTDKPYGYSLVGDDYRLTYEMKLDFESTDSTFSSGSYYKDNYAEGTNTATSNDESTEKQTSSEQYELNLNINASLKSSNTNTNTAVNTNTSVYANTNTSVTSSDSDGDGIIDSSEVAIYKTDPNKRDTDDDGLSDYLEVTACQTNPTLNDTDQDGFLDLAEVQNGYNPKGDGKATSTLCLEYYNAGR